MRADHELLSGAQLSEVELVRVPAAPVRIEARVGDVAVLAQVVGLVVEPELRELPFDELVCLPVSHYDLVVREVRVDLVGEVDEEVDVVVAQRVAPVRAVLSGSTHLDAMAAQPFELARQVLARIDPVHALKGDEVVVPADLVALLLKVVQLGYQGCSVNRLPGPRLTVVGSAVEDEVGRRETAT